MNVTAFQTKKNTKFYLEQKSLSMPQKKLCWSTETKKSCLARILASFFFSRTFPHQHHNVHPFVE